MGSYEERWLGILERGKVPYSLRYSRNYFFAAYYFGWTPEQLDSVDCVLAEKLFIWLNHHIIEEAKKFGSEVGKTKSKLEKNKVNFDSKRSVRRR